MSGSAAYLDTSAFLKLVMPEQESAALIEHLRQRPIRVSAGLLCTEALRAAGRASPARMAAVRRQLRGVVLIELDRSLLDRAGTLAPADLRSLDAIHIAAALSIGTDLAELVTYDARMAAAARGQGLITISPV
ncbi:MAG TPA: type II toxin-antitoxin system VapC family toxin [Candidatus Dormibacteraeota bacterium]|nr:type II toxin-antitoxin system VapC family toxin [Candidatus Dormibacteraeota bacterium]